jgi:hypothetical protein
VHWIESHVWVPPLAAITLSLLTTLIRCAGLLVGLAIAMRGDVNDHHAAIYREFARAILGSGKLDVLSLMQSRRAGKHPMQ